MSLEKELSAVCEPILKNAGYELVLCELAGSARNRIVRFYIDKETGVGIDECTEASRLIDPVIEQSELLNGAYVLEVSSPGLERPLVKPEDYNRFAGRKAKLKTYRPVDNRRKFIGTIIGIREGKTIELELDEGVTVEVPYEDVAKSNLVFEWKNN